MQLTLSKKTLLAILASPFAAAMALARPEKALVASAKNRDKEAFGQLMEVHSSAIRKFIARRVDVANREDVYQETWLAAWEALINFDSSSRLRTWLYSICFHKIQDHWRREHRRPLSNQIADADGRAAYLPKEFATVELQDALKQFWESCTPDQRELLRMYYSDGLTLNEIGSILGRNLNTVKYQFYKAHSDAKEKLLADGYAETWGVS